ncbi:hypothetical protein CIT292_08056 [Citrobacter youngae ATCC 29220]|uniref:Uncharacterized protein n=1 Tax=Citrobacter youngae ATCC 29220 TaxID=500640 RepID=D4BBL0_9ENTR|nr:hypothetical protein CIT292_08056 [Citrobacter youngae ATCC 29220]
MVFSRVHTGYFILNHCVKLLSRSLSEKKAEKRACETPWNEN